MVFSKQNVQHREHTEVADFNYQSYKDYLIHCVVSKVSNLLQVNIQQDDRAPVCAVRSWVSEQKMAASVLHLNPWQWEQLLLNYAN